MLCCASESRPCCAGGDGVQEFEKTRDPAAVFAPNLKGTSAKELATKAPTTPRATQELEKPSVAEASPTKTKLEETTTPTPKVQDYVEPSQISLEEKQTSVNDGSGGNSVEILFKSPSGEEKRVVFDSRPLLLHLRKQAPMHVRSVAGGAAHRAGVQRGWQAVSVDGELVNGLSASGIWEALQKKTAALPAKGPKMAVSFKQPDGSITNADFFQRPLGFNFGLQQPILVNGVTGLCAREMGIASGWQIVAVDGRRLDGGMDFEQAYGILKHSASSLPEMRSSMRLGFALPDGSEKELEFCEKPLGIYYELRKPMRVDGVDEARSGSKLGVRVGWELVSLDGLRLTSMEFEDANRLLTDATEELKPAQPAMSR